MDGMTWGVSVETGEGRARTDTGHSIVRGWTERKMQPRGVSSAQETRKSANV